MEADDFLFVGTVTDQPAVAHKVRPPKHRRQPKCARAVDDQLLCDVKHCRGENIHGFDMCGGKCVNASADAIDIAHLLGNQLYTQVTSNGLDLSQSSFLLRIN